MPGLAVTALRPRRFCQHDSGFGHPLPRRLPAIRYFPRFSKRILLAKPFADQRKRALLTFVFHDALRIRPHQEIASRMLDPLPIMSHGIGLAVDYMHRRHTESLTLDVVHRGSQFIQKRKRLPNAGLTATMNAVRRPQAQTDGRQGIAATVADQHRRLQFIPQILGLTQLDAICFCGMLVVVPSYSNRGPQAQKYRIVVRQPRVQPPQAAWPIAATLLGDYGRNTMQPA